MTEEQAFERISQLIKAGITNRQLARMVGVPVEVVLEERISPPFRLH